MPETMEEKIARINVLYHKSKAEGLTAEEKEEQARLRADYISNIRRNMRSQLDLIDVANEDGSITRLKDHKNKKAAADL